MNKSKNNERERRELNKIFNGGVTALVLGVAFFMAPSLLSKSANLKGLGASLSSFALPAFCGGLLMLGLYFLLKRMGHQHVDPHTSTASATSKPILSAQSLAASTPAAVWSPAVFAAIEWRRFEAVCEALFSQAGFETRSQSHGADGGVDIWLHSANALGPVSMVQCKHWRSRPVGVKDMREFYGVMTSHKLLRGTYATTSAFTADALQFAKDNGINAMNGTRLLMLIATRTPEQQQALLAVAYEGDYARPTCASCGVKLLERAASKTGKAFWGCRNYPSCKSTLPMLAA